MTGVQTCALPIFTNQQPNKELNTLKQKRDITHTINGGGTAPTPNFASRNPQTGGGDSGGNRTVIIKYEGLIYGDKDKIARDLYDAFAKAGRDGAGR